MYVHENSAKTRQRVRHPSVVNTSSAHPVNAALSKHWHCEPRARSPGASVGMQPGAAGIYAICRAGWNPTAPATLPRRIAGSQTYAAADRHHVVPPRVPAAGMSHDRTASVFNIDHCPGAIARQHLSSGLLWVSDSMGALTPPSVRGSPCHQSGGSVPAHNQVLTHGQRTWMALEKHAGRSTETIPRAWERNASHLVLELGGLREERGCRLPV